MTIASSLPQTNINRHRPAVETLPDQRWIWAHTWAHTGQKPQHVDASIQLARDFLLWQKSRRGLGKIPRRFLDMMQLDQLMIHQKRLRGLIQGYLWTDCTLQEISAATHTALGVIRLFRDLFYDVSPYRDASDARMSLILNGRTPNQVPADDEEFYLAFYAIHGGRLALEATRTYYDYRHELDLPKESLTAKQRKRRSTLQFTHVAILLRSVKSSLFQTNTLMELLAMTEQLQKISFQGPGLLKPVPQLPLGEDNRRYLESIATKLDSMAAINAMLALGA